MAIGRQEDDCDNVISLFDAENCKRDEQSGEAVSTPYTFRRSVLITLKRDFGLQDEQIVYKGDEVFIRHEGGQMLLSEYVKCITKTRSKAFSVPAKSVPRWTTRPKSGS